MEQAAETLVLNGNLYTLNPRQPWAEALAIRDGKIIAVGSNAQIDEYRSGATQIIDAAGRMVLPGLVDTHCHLSMETVRELYSEFRASTVAEVQSAVRARASERPSDPVILAWALLIGSAEKTDRRELDQAISDRPVLVYDGHHVFANSKALDQAGITRDTPDPDGGEIYRDSNGEPTGILKEAAGRMALSRLTPRPGRERAATAYRKTFRHCNEVGLVRLHSVGFDIRHIGIFDELRQQAELAVRLHVASVVYPPSLRLEQVEEMEELRHRYHDEWIDAGVVKFFEDGLVEMHTAAMVEPYVDAGGSTGEPHWSLAELTKAVLEMNRRGFRVLIHAIGDRSVREALDAYETIRHSNGKNNSILRIEHAEHVDDADIGRFAKLGVIVSMHPLFAESVWAAQQMRVGAERMRLAFAWRSIAATGAKVVFGSDFPAYPLNPWEAIQALLTRHPMPQERVTLAQAIEGYTLAAAFAGGLETTEGSLEAGKNADLIMISHNLFETDPREIAKTRVLLTMVGGRIFHQSF